MTPAARVCALVHTDGAAGGIAVEALFAMRTVAALSLESTFNRRYSANLTTAKRVEISGRCVLGLGFGLLFASFLVLQSVGFLYGGFALADQMTSSSYEYKRNVSFEVPVAIPCPNGVGMCQTTVETEMEAHYCANSDNWLQNVSFDNCSVFDPPLAPLQMNCQVARLFELFDGADAFSVANLSVLELISQPSWSALRNFSLEQSEPGYAEAYPNYWGCALDGAIIIIAVTFVMQGTFALGQAAKPLGDFAAGLSASASLLKVTNRVSLIDSFSTDGVTPSSVTGTIEVRDVHFAYPTAPDVPVCKGYSLKVEAGQTVALSGPSAVPMLFMKVSGGGRVMSPARRRTGRAQSAAP